jgi:hypothetical protein
VDQSLATVVNWAQLDPAHRILVETKATLAAAVAALIEAAAPSQNPARDDLELPKRNWTSRDQRPLVAAVRLVAFCLHSLFGVRWACECVEKMQGGQSSALDRDAVAAGRQWIDKPSNENRRKAMLAAEASGMRSSAAWAAVAAAWSGGPALHADASEDDGVTWDANHHQLCAKAVAGAITLAGLEGGADDLSTRYLDMIETGLAIASEA